MNIKRHLHNKFTYNMILLELQTGWSLDERSFPNPLPFLHKNVPTGSHTNNLHSNGFRQKFLWRNKQQAEKLIYTQYVQLFDTPHFAEISKEQSLGKKYDSHLLHRIEFSQF